MTKEMIGLTACSKSKNGENERDREFKAKNLYDSWLFNCRVSALQAHCDEWAIFSAKHAYVEPEEKLTWYDKCMADLDWEERVAIAREAVDELPETDKLMIVMGRDYADPLKHVLPDDVEVWDPLEGVGLFDQRGELRDLAAETKQAKLVTDGGQSRSCGNEPTADGTEHTIRVRSVQVWEGGFDADFIDEEGNLREIAEELEFQKEKSISFRCSCGRRYQKWRTAADHIRSVDAEIGQEEA